MDDKTITYEMLADLGVGSVFRPRDIKGSGLSYHDLQRAVEHGSVERVARGLYRLAEAPVTELYDVALVCASVPTAIVCLFTALRIHGIGTSLPRHVWIAIPHRARTPRIRELPVRIIRFSGAALHHGIVEFDVEGIPTRITSPARTVVDCFRLHRHVDRETAVEALRESLFDRKATEAELRSAAEALGVLGLIDPYIQATLA